MNLSVRIDMIETGNNIANMRRKRNLTVKDVQEAMGFHTPQAIFKWQRGEALPTIDNLVILSELFAVPIDEILIKKRDLFPI